VVIKTVHPFYNYHKYFTIFFIRLWVINLLLLSTDISIDGPVLL